MSANQNDAPAVEAVVKFVNLVSNDEILVNINMKAARKSTVIANLLDCFPSDSEQADMKIPLPNVDGETLRKIVSYLEHHMNDPEDSPIKETEFDKEFVPANKDKIQPLILASNYLDVAHLTDLCAKKWAELLKGKSPAEMREIIGVENDFTKEEQKKVAEEYEWIHDKK